MILLIDNYDSFVFNLARYFGELGLETRVVRNDAVSVDDVATLRPQAIVLSPGPCTPTEGGISVELVQRLYRDVPILGVCLGHQAIGAAFGADVVRAAEPVHGRTSSIWHASSPLFGGLPNPFIATRYHSLIVVESTLPPELAVTARTADDLVMAVEHVSAPLFGVQFHPESVLTEHGHGLLANFLRSAGISIDRVPPGDRPEITVGRLSETSELELESSIDSRWVGGESLDRPLHW